VTGRVWRGTAFGGIKGRSEVPVLVDRYLKNEIKVDEMITHTMAIKDINHAFDLMHEGKSIRSMVTF
jgi:S-(hydroxymethyl)glutathione dehydrogenase/alcohol dehydrogenase